MHQMDAVYVWQSSKARARDYLPVCGVLRHVKLQNDCKTSLLFCESLQHFLRVSLMDAKTFALMAAQNFSGIAAKPIRNPQQRHTLLLDRG